MTKVEELRMRVAEFKTMMPEGSKAVGYGSITILLICEAILELDDRLKPSEPDGK